MARTSNVFLALALLANSVTPSSASYPEAAAIIERHLGYGGALGKTTLLLMCKEGSKNACTVSRTGSDARPVTGKITRADATQFLREFLREEESYIQLHPSKPKSQVGIKPILTWAVSIDGQRMRGEISSASHLDDVAVVELERKVLSSLK
jgi:hypothetical protein